MMEEHDRTPAFRRVIRLHLGLGMAGLVYHGEARCPSDYRVHCDLAALRVRFCTSGVSMLMSTDTSSYSQRTLE